MTLTTPEPDTIADEGLRFERLSRRRNEILAIARETEPLDDDLLREFAAIGSQLRTLGTTSRPAKVMKRKLAPNIEDL